MVNPVAEINKINNDIYSLEQRKTEIAFQHHAELIKYDLERLEEIEGNLTGLLVTTEASKLVEEYDVEGTIEVIITELKRELEN